MCIGNCLQAKLGGKVCGFDPLGSIKLAQNRYFGEVRVVWWLVGCNACLRIGGGSRGSPNGFQIIFCTQYQTVFALEVLLEPQHLLAEVPESIVHCGRAVMHSDKHFSV